MPEINSARRRSALLSRGRRLVARLGLAVVTVVAGSVGSLGVAGPLPVHACAACIAQTDASITGFAQGYGYSYSSGYGQYSAYGNCAIAGTAAALPAEECGVNMYANYSFPSIVQGTTNVSISFYASTPVAAYDRSYGCNATLAYDYEGPDNGAISGTCTEYFGGSGASRTVQLIGRVLVTWGDFSPVYLPLTNAVQVTFQLATVAS